MRPGPVVAVGAGVAAILVALAGRYGYHRDELYFPEARPPPCVAWAYLALLAIFLVAVAGGKDYYLAPMYAPLIAAGAVVLERRLRPVAATGLSGRRRRGDRGPDRPPGARAERAGRLPVGRPRRGRPGDDWVATLRRHRRARRERAAT